MEDGLVLLTPLDGASLGGDIAARLANGRLEQGDRWSALQGLFGVRAVDPRLRTHRWLADALLEHAPPSGYPPAKGGVLDLETAWQAALEHGLGLREGRTDLPVLLAWSLDPTSPERFAALGEAARRGLRERLEAAGEAGAWVVLAAAAAGRLSDAAAIALACGVVFAEAEPRPTLREAAVRLEPLLGGARVDGRAGKALAGAARRLLRDLPRDRAEEVQKQGAALLSELRADDAAALSPALAVGLEARIGEAATALATVASSCDSTDARRAWSACNMLQLTTEAASKVPAESG